MKKIWPFGKSEQQEFEQLVTPHLKRLYKLAFRFTGKRDDAEDLVQDILLKLYPRLDEMKRVDHLGSWMARVLYRHFIDKLRSNKRSLLQLVDDETILEDYSDTTQSPPTDLDMSILQNRLEYSLNQLNGDQRLLVMMHDVEGYTLQEIHNLHDVSIGTLKSRLNRARSRLREILKNMEPFEAGRRVNE